MESTGHYRSPKQRYTLRDVYNAAKYEKNFNYVFWLHITFDIVGEQVMKCAGYCLVVMATSLIAGISALGFLVVIPSITSPGSVAQVCHIIWGMFLVFCIYFNYFLAVLTKPGSPQECAVPQLTLSENNEQASNETLKMCKKCNYTKPKRTHHCSICNQCVMKMDHHCPWVSNCVGYRNYRYFVSFLFWVTLAVLYVACISGSKVFSSGSILFPGPGQPSLLHALWGGKQRNIYSILYDLLADSEGHQNNKNLAAPDTLDALEHRRMADSDAPDALAPAGAASYVDFKTLPAVVTMQHDRAPVGGAQRYLSSEVDASFAEVRAEQEFVEGHRAGHHSTHLVDRKHWRSGSVLSWIAPDDILIFMAFMISLGVSFGTGMLLMLHMYLLSSGYTTIEYFESTEVMKHCQKNNIIYKHPYDRGFWANFAEVFGPLPWYLALLPSTREPPPAFYLSQDRCVPERCGASGHAHGASYSGENELILGSTAVSTSGGQGNSPTLRTSVSGAPLWERNRSGDNISGIRAGVENGSDVEEGGMKAHSR